MKSPLYDAVKAQDLDAIKVYCENEGRNEDDIHIELSKVDPETKLSPFELAARTCSAKIMIYLLSIYSLSTSREYYFIQFVTRKSLLVNAIEAGNHEVVNLFVHSSAYVELLEDQTTELHVKAAVGDVKFVSDYIKNKPAHVANENYLRMTALSFAVLANQSEMINLLISNQKCNEFLLPTIHLSAAIFLERGDEEAADELLQMWAGYYLSYQGGTKDADDKVKACQNQYNMLYKRFKTTGIAIHPNELYAYIRAEEGAKFYQENKFEESGLSYSEAIQYLEMMPYEMLYDADEITRIGQLRKNYRTQMNYADEIFFSSLPPIPLTKESDKNASSNILTNFGATTADIFSAIEKLTKPVQTINKPLPTRNDLLLEQLKQVATQWGFISHDVKRDGSCFFQALLDQLKILQIPNVNRMDVDYLRARTIDCLASQRLLFEDFYSPNAQDGHSNFDEYIDVAKRYGFWANEDLIKAASMAFGISIVVFADTRPPVIHKYSDNAPIAYFGLVQEYHYQSFRPIPGHAHEAIQNKVREIKTEDSEYCTLCDEALKAENEIFFEKYQKEQENKKATKLKNKPQSLQPFSILSSQAPLNEEEEYHFGLDLKDEAISPKFRRFDGLGDS